MAAADSSAQIPGEFLHAQGPQHHIRRILGQRNHTADIEDDMRALVPQILYQGEAGVTKSLEMLVRAYDPCISCSTHILDVTFE